MQKKLPQCLRWRKVFDCLISRDVVKELACDGQDFELRVGLRAKTMADYDRLIGLIAAQPFAENVIPGRKPADGGS